MQLKAYHVQEDHEAHCCIVFATNSAAARRQGAGELGTEWEFVEFCRRAPWADQYAGRRGGVPDHALIDQGWRVPCNCGCDQVIYEDLIHDEEEDCDPVFVGNWTYYNSEHHDTEVAEIKARQELERAVADEARAKFPGAEITYIFHGTSRSNQPGVDMRVPGLQGRVTWQRGDDTVSVQKRDVDAWHAYAQRIKGAA
ncbi:hypothetical protein [Salinicola peritrichatus]|uniref:hypothetical protein n=1 Tax=Salinicola peritrichatus TaxID=1267424 RepID=UPI0019551858|nr:hypothetical protein [Salinicola peritrichatus]